MTVKLTNPIYVHLFTAITVFLLFACNNEYKSKAHIREDEMVQIDLDSGKQTYPLSSSIDSINAINLEINDSSSVISSAYAIRKVILKNGRAYIFDSKFMAINVFDLKNGKFLFKIGALGIGKGEFTNVQDLIFYPMHNSFWVLCNTPRKIVEFSIDGTFIKEIRLDFFGSNMAVEPPNNLYYYINQNNNKLTKKNNIIITDTGNSIKDRFFPFPGNFSNSISFSGGLFTTDNQIYYNPPFSNIFYLLSGGNASALYKVNFGTESLPANFDFKALYNYNFIYNNFVKTPEYIGFNFSKNKRFTTAFYNTKSKAIITSEANTDSLNWLFSGPIFESDGKLMMLININTFSDDRFIRNKNEIKQRFPELYNKIILKKEHDNPSLLFFTLKK